MASSRDDSSVDGTVSSVGESTWDMIDEASVASEDVASMPSRAPGSASEGIENVYVSQPRLSQASDVKSAGSEESASEESDQEDLVSEHIMSEPSHSPQATPVALYAQKTDTPVYGLESSYTQEWMGTIHMDNTSEVYPRLGIKVASASACSFDEQVARRQLADRKDAKNIIPLTGKVQMGLKDGGLEVKDTFKLLYYGPKEMKSAITQKIGSALAANPRRPLLNDGPASSRVTVVPISGFMDESSPEVVMIESGGIDMIIEECIGAQLNESGGIRLDVESGNTITHWVERSNGSCKLRVSAPTGIPDLGIIYLAENSASSKRHSDGIIPQDTYLTQLFFHRFGIPYYVIDDIDWLDQVDEAQMAVVDRYKFVPHRSVEALVDGKLQTWSKLPVDLTTFLALDASQLHQNLVALKSASASTHDASWMGTLPFTATLGEIYESLLIQICEVADMMRSGDAKTWMCVLFILLSLFSASMISSSYFGTPLGHGEEHVRGRAVQSDPTSLSRLSMSRSQVDIQAMSTTHSLIDLLASETHRFTGRVQVTRKKDAAGFTRKQNTYSRSRDLLVRVVGDSHILIRSFKPSNGANSLHFETKRNGKLLPHQLQKIDDEYLVLEFPAADAYGQVEIRIWTTTKPRYNETFEIDLGIPWFKIKGWRELAVDVADTATQEAQALQQNLLQGLKRGTVAFNGSRTKKAILETIANFSASVSELEQALGSGSSKLLRKSTRNLVKAQRKLSKLARKAQQASVERSSQVLAKQTHLKLNMKELMQLLSERLVEQQVRFERTMGKLHKTAMSQRLPGISKRQLRQAQKTLLRAWWKLRGRPT